MCLRGYEAQEKKEENLKPGYFLKDIYIKYFSIYFKSNTFSKYYHKFLNGLRFYFRMFVAVALFDKGLAVSIKTSSARLYRSIARLKPSFNRISQPSTIDIPSKYTF